MTIDLRSDTVTKPTEAMKAAMMATKVGDDVFGEDPAVNALEAKTAEMFGMGAGLFCPSGTMTNQIAIKVHTQPGDEVICDELSHIYQYEGGGIAFNSGCSMKLLHGDLGRVSPEDIKAAINPDDVHKPVSKMVSIENTMNKGGGACYTLKQMQAISETCKTHDLNLHLDGARIFNALIATNLAPADLHGLFDSISICLSKGLGIPVGSVLLGSKEFIKKARRVRKVLGGGMRQAGFLAAAGIYALDHHVERLSEDHKRAKELGNILSKLSFVESTIPVESNIVVATLKPSFPLEAFLEKLLAKNIKAVPFGPQQVRFVTHLDIDDAMVARVKDALEGME